MVCLGCGSDNLRSIRLLLVALALVLGLGACAEEGSAPAPPAAASASSALAAAADGARFSDPRSGVSFPLPEGLSARVEHFDPTTPAGTFKHTVTLEGVPGVVLRLDVWHNPARLPLRRWFERYLSFTRLGEASLSWQPLGAGRVPGLLVVRPRSGQAHGQRIALLAAGERVVRLTCQDQDRESFLAAFNGVLSGLTLEAAR